MDPTHIKGEICTKVYEHTELEYADEIYDLVENLDNYHINNHRRLLSDVKKKQKELDDTINTYNKKLDDYETSNKNFHKSIRPIFVIRQAINKLFNQLWDQHRDTVPPYDFNVLASKTKILKRPELINDEHRKGLKYALYVINKLFDHVPIQLAEFYITLNEEFHPKSKPSKIVIDNINLLKELIQKGSLPTYFSRTGLNRDILEQLEQAVNKYE